MCVPGARDTSRLSKKDSRKNKGESTEGVKKSNSKKSERVGLAAKKKREAAVAVSKVGK